jgi:hypothetical protein
MVERRRSLFAACAVEFTGSWFVGSGFTEGSHD